MGATNVLEREWKFYDENKERLRTEFPKRFLVIVGDAVVGNYDSREEALFEAAKKFGIGKFLLQDVADEKVVHRFHSRVRL